MKRELKILTELIEAGNNTFLCPNAIYVSNRNAVVGFTKELYEKLPKSIQEKIHNAPKGIQVGNSRKYI